MLTEISLVDLIQIVALSVQICVACWIACQWKSQKKAEGYAYNVSKVLSHWHNIYYYCHLLVGKNNYSRKKFIEWYNREIDSILIFESFLHHPDIYLDSNDTQSIEKIEDFKRVYTQINNTLWVDLSTPAGSDSKEDMLPSTYKDLKSRLFIMGFDEDFWGERFPEAEKYLRTPHLAVEEQESRPSSNGDSIPDDEPEQRKSLEANVDSRIINLFQSVVEEHVESMKKILLKYTTYDKRSSKKYFLTKLFTQIIQKIRHPRFLKK